MWLTFTRARHAFAVFVLSLYPEGKKMISGCTRHPILDADIFEKKNLTCYHLSRFLIYMPTYLIKSDSTPRINPSQKCITKLYKNVTKTQKLFTLRNKIWTLTLELTAEQGVIF